MNVWVLRLMEAFVFFVVFFGGIFLVSIIIVALLRRVLWAFSGLFLLVDELMWFLYNPLRPFMKDRERAANRVFFYLGV